MSEDQGNTVEVLEEKAEQLRREAERLGEVVEAMNQTMGTTSTKTTLYTLIGSLAFLPVIVGGSYLGSRLATRKIAG